MAEGSGAIGLSWSPKVSFTSGRTKNKSDSPQLSTVKNGNELVDGLFLPPSDPRKLNKLLKKNMKDTIGKNWFDMPAPTITPEVKKDLEILKLRSAIDPKRHYKKGEGKLKDLPKYFQVGTVVESTSDYYSSRLTKKERKQTIADELLADLSFKSYRKRKVREIDDALRPAGVEKWKIRGRHTLQRAKQRREPRRKRG